MSATEPVHPAILKNAAALHAAAQNWRRTSDAIIAFNTPATAIDANACTRIERRDLKSRLFNEHERAEAELRSVLARIDKSTSES